MPATLFIATIGAISVIKAVYIDKRDIKCACIGGGSSVPLGFISLTENLMMIAMAVWMLVKYGDETKCGYFFQSLEAEPWESNYLILLLLNLIEISKIEKVEIMNFEVIIAEMKKMFSNTPIISIPEKGFPELIVFSPDQWREFVTNVNLSSSKFIGNNNFCLIEEVLLTQFEHVLIPVNSSRRPKTSNFVYILGRFI